MEPVNFWDDRARDLGRLLSAMPDFDASGYDAEQLQQILTTYAPPLVASADEARRLYFGKMEPRMFATVYATFRHTEMFRKG